LEKAGIGSSELIVMGSTALSNAAKKLMEGVETRSESSKRAYRLDRLLH
jgi:hypothetical protein